MDGGEWQLIDAASVRDFRKNLIFVVELVLLNDESDVFVFLTRLDANAVAAINAKPWLPGCLSPEELSCTQSAAFSLFLFSFPFDASSRPNFITGF